MSEQDQDISKAMTDAQQVCEAMSVAFTAWMQAQPDGTVIVMGAGTGVAKLAGLVLEKITDGPSRDSGVAGAIATLLINSECNIEAVLSFVGQAMEAHALASAETVGHA